VLVLIAFVGRHLAPAPSHRTGASGRAGAWLRSGRETAPSLDPVLARPSPRPGSGEAPAPGSGAPDG
jgi:hypothetical protein